MSSVADPIYASILFAEAGSSEGGADFPQRVSLKTKTETFNRDHYIVVRDCRIWRRPNEEVKGERGPWELLGPYNGVPGNGSFFGGFEFPEGGCVEEISADGENIVAVDGDRRVYYAKFYALDEWDEEWGMASDEFHIPEDSRAWAISHRMRYYSDIHGNRHPVGPGVTTMYMLASDGLCLPYVDPWLPPDWDGYEVLMPLNGSVVAASMSASASTLFVMGEDGRMFTRLYDYDTSGQDPILSYSWKEEVRTGSRKYTRSLPNWEWSEIRRPPGRYTGLITIFQDDREGNDGFTLRVEGEDDAGRTGFWEKGIADEEWHFTADGRAIVRDFVDPDDVGRLDLYRAIETKTLKGVMGRDGAGPYLWTELKGFHARAERATLTVYIGGEAHDIPCHFRKNDVPDFFGIWGEDEGEISLSATLLIPESISASGAPHVQEAWKKVFDRRAIVDFTVEGDSSRLEFEEDHHLFGIPEIADALIFTFMRFFKEEDVGLFESWAWGDRELKGIYGDRLTIDLE